MPKTPATTTPKDVFESLCVAIATHSKLPARTKQSVSAQTALSSMVNAGIALIGAEADAAVLNDMLRAAATTHSTPLVSAFPKQNPNAVAINRYMSSDLPKRASPEFLAALVDAGCDLFPFNLQLVMRAIRKDDKALQDFLLTTVHIIPRDVAELLEALKSKHLTKTPDFVAAYLKLLVKAQPELSEQAITSALATYADLEFALLYHAGARVNYSSTTFVPDMARDLYDQLSNHKLLQFAAEGEDLAAFCRDEETHARAMAMLRTERRGS